MGKLDKQRKEAESRIKNYLLIVKNIKEKDNQLMQKLNLDPNNNYSHPELMSLFNKVALSLNSSMDTPIHASRKIVSKWKINLNSEL